MNRRALPLAAVLTAASAVIISHSTQASATTGACAGTLIYNKVDYANGSAIAELAVYYDSSTGNNCARVSHLGASYGHSENTFVDMYRCTQDQPNTGCTPVSGSGVADSGNYAYYAGPISVHAPNNCIVANGDMYWTDGLHAFNTGPIGC